MRRRMVDGKMRAVRVQRTSRCGKAAYRGRKVALAKAAEQTRITGELIEAYRCPYGCHAWHIGHPPGTKAPLVGRREWT